MTRRFIRDAVERVASTYVQAFCTFLLASGIGVTGVVDMSVLKKAAVASIAGALSAIKAMLARRVGDSESASLAKPPIVG